MSNKWDAVSDNNTSSSGLKLISFKSQVHKDDDDLNSFQQSNQYGQERKTLFEQLAESNEQKKRELESKLKPSMLTSIFCKTFFNTFFYFNA